MDQIDKKILALIQQDFPLTSQPYKAIGETLGLREEEVLARLQKLAQEGIIRRLGAIFDSRKLGYKSTLCAMEVPEEQLEEVTALVNSYPGVTHNYLRQHSYNLWFTLITPTQEVLASILQEIEEKTGIKVYNLPATKLFKIKVNFTVPGLEETKHEPQP